MMDFPKPVGNTAINYHLFPIEKLPWQTSILLSKLNFPSVTETFIENILTWKPSCYETGDIDSQKMCQDSCYFAN